MTPREGSVGAVVLAIAAGMVLFAKNPAAQTPVEHSSEARFQLDVHAPDAAIASYLPPGFTLNVATQGAAKDCNLRVVFIDRVTINTPDGKPAGPIGDEIAKLLAAGYTDKAAPVNGYYFRTLTAQGPNARLGARDYIVQGKMIGGFAAIAWPANYGVTGVQTFQVNNDGIVYQKDLGPETAKRARAIQRYDPDKTWTVTEDVP